MSISDMMQYSNAELLSMFTPIELRRTWEAYRHFQSTKEFAERIRKLLEEKGVDVF